MVDDGKVIRRKKWEQKEEGYEVLNLCYGKKWIVMSKIY